MKHEIDLKDYKIRTDLIVESITTDEVDSNDKIIDGIKVSEVYLDNKNASKLNKKEGNYITIEFDDVTDVENREKVIDVLSNQFRKLLEKNQIKDNDSCLIVGLGNSKSTPDSLGPLTVNDILVTNHLFMLGDVEDGIRRVSAINPGVMGTTGIETSLVIKSICKDLKPNFIIAIDALASSSISRVNKTIQLTDTGIHPGSGVGNSRKEISKDSIGIPVLALGVPTVVDAVTIVSDTINYIDRHFAYRLSNFNNKSLKLTPASKINYLDSNNKMDKQNKNRLLGEIGNLTDAEIKELLFEILTPIGSNLMVTPKEVDFVIENLSEVLSTAINNALHKKLI